VHTLADEMSAIVDEARKATPVMAHAHGDEGAAAAIRAGVRSVEHGSFLSDATLNLMKQRDRYLVPTIAMGEVIAARPAPQDEARVSQEQGRRVIRVGTRDGASGARAEGTDDLVDADSCAWIHE